MLGMNVPRKFKCAAAMVMIGAVYSARGSKSACAVVTDQGVEQGKAEQLCRALAVEWNSSRVDGTCEEGEKSYLLQVKSECESLGGFRAKDRIIPLDKKSSTRAVLGKVISFELSGDQETLTAMWQLDPEKVNLHSDLLVSFRYTNPRGSKDVMPEINIFTSEQGSSFVTRGAVPVQIDPTTSNDWCLTAPVKVRAIAIGESKYGIQLTATYKPTQMLAIDGIVLHYESLAQGALGVEQYKSSTGKLFSQCIPGTSWNCACQGADEAENRLGHDLMFTFLVATGMLVCCAFAVFAWRRLQIGRIPDGSRVNACSEGSASSSSASPRSSPKQWLLKHFGSSDLFGLEEPQRRSSHGISIDQEVAEETHVPDQTERLQLISILRDPVHCEKFTEFVKDNFPNESLLFYESIETYQTSPDKRWRQQEAASMIARFVGPNSLYRVELSRAVETALLGAVVFPRTLFDDARIEVYNMMQRSYLEPYLEYFHALKESGLQGGNLPPISTLSVV